ncbi:TPA: hypothetical protein ACXE07_004958, partial [Serratia marcescens]
MSLNGENNLLPPTPNRRGNRPLTICHPPHKHDKAAFKPSVRLFSITAKVRFRGFESNEKVTPMITTDGNNAVASVAYRTNEVI